MKDMTDSELLDAIERAMRIVAEEFGGRKRPSASLGGRRRMGQGQSRLLPSSLRKSRRIPLQI